MITLSSNASQAASSPTIDVTQVRPTAHCKQLVHLLPTLDRSILSPVARWLLYMFILYP